MIGFIHKSRAFRHYINYCLKDKLTPKIDGEERQVAFRHRAEIIHFNQCYGTMPELARQFSEVVALNRNVCKPYLNIVLGLPPQDRLTSSQWADISVEFSKVLGFDQRQFLAIQHKDTAHSHVHLLANRIGFDGDALIEEDNWLRPMNQFCRQTEVVYGLSQTQSMPRYQTREQGEIPRQSQRLDRLRETIEMSLKTACSASAFEEEMREHGYKVYRNDRGIAFHEAGLIIHRGSEAGYPWKRIEHILAENAMLEQRKRQEQEQSLRKEIAEQEILGQRHGLRLHL